MHCAAYNSRIPGMLTQLSWRFVRSLVFVLAVLYPPAVQAQNWAGTEEQLAGKIVSATGQKAIVLEVLNRSSLSSTMTDDIRHNLLTQLAALGVRFVASDQAAATVRVTLSEDLQNYVWVAEIMQGPNASSVVMVSLPRPAALSPEPEAAAMVVHKTLLWSQQERVLDVAVIDGNSARMVVLDAAGVSVYRFQDRDSRWQLEQSLPIAHSRPWPRDLRGRLVLRKDKEKDHLFDIYLPGVYCNSPANGALTCSESAAPWTIGTDPFSLNASFTWSRNYFNGTFAPGVGNQTTAPAFYSAAAAPRDQAAWWLLTAIDGKVHLLDGSTDQALARIDWGSDIASVHSGCGTGWQVLATRGGDRSRDAVQAFEVVGREPVAASAPLDMSGPVTALWTESGGASAAAAVHNSETGRYEAFRLTVTCSR